MRNSKIILIIKYEKNMLVPSLKILHKNVLMKTDEE
jgi:hypothetical protein